MFGLGLRPLQEALDRKADQVQREFIEIGDRIEDLGKKLLEAEGEERKQIREQQQALRENQQDIAQQVNLWRERARAVTQQPGQESLRAYLNELLALEDKTIQPAVEQALRVLDLPPEELAQFEEKPRPDQQTPAARLIQRARSEYDLRGSDRAVRQREAVDFANRPGMWQDDAAMEEIASAMEDSDPIVQELAILTTIQLHRFRALRIADLDVAHNSVQYLARLNHMAVVPTLIEVLENPRSGFLQRDMESEESDNSRSRMVALLRLVEWHTAEAQAAIQTRRFDRDEAIVKAAERALQLFPDPWTGPLKGE
ncbi:MAG: hypothetical protein GTO14_02710 [Anaerolineales bacterium]|nr:hypothetical protein [Anaerolineales bacterium]